MEKPDAGSWGQEGETQSKLDDMFGVQQEKNP